MVDRLKELLALMEEDDEEEREDAPALESAEVPSSRAPEGGAEVRGEGEAPAWDEAPGALAEAGALEWMAGRGQQALERDGAPEADGGAESGSEGDGGAENGAVKSFWDELAAAVARAEGPVALRRPGAGDVEIMEADGASERTAAAEELGAVADSLTEEERGLEGLYRQAVRASRPVDQALPADRAGRTARADQPGSTAALTVEELDRAVRRDSRRYDGGMTIF